MTEVNEVKSVVPPVPEVAVPPIKAEQMVQSESKGQCQTCHHHTPKAHGEWGHAHAKANI